VLALPHIVGLSIFAVEIGHVLRRRSRATHDQRTDRGSLRLIWVSVAVGVVLAQWLHDNARSGRFELSRAGVAVALACVVLGLAFRLWAIAKLGRFFTVDVAIREGHELMTSGPFRFVRHPSYTGLFAMFVGWSVLFQNAWSIVALLVPFTIALLYRVHVEEAALEASFGASYAEYRARTKRLLPGVY
jgi:protein-S-isoprenylcysteine O-methyltransferase